MVIDVLLTDMVGLDEREDIRLQHDEKAAA